MNRKRRDQPRRDDEALARIVEDVVDRRRAGESPRAEDYADAHPGLGDVIARRLKLIDWLEAGRSGPGSMTSATSCDLSTALADLPEREQRLVYLRLVERAPWPTIAGQLGGSDEDLRKEHASVVRRLVERCHEWLTGTASSPAPDSKRR